MAGSGFFYGLVAAVGVAILASQLPKPEPRPAPAAPPVIAAPPPSAPEPALSSSTGVTLRRAADGHFYADAEVNGTAVRFLIDTGASGIVLTRSDAMRAAIGAGNFSAQGIGVGGKVRLQPVVLTRLALGEVVADNVPAMVAETDLPVSLLGQSFLGRWREVTIAGDALTLR